MTDTCHVHGLHDHSGPAGSPERRLAAVLLLVIVYFLAELLGGWWTGSLALLADAGHMFSDMAALTIGLVAAWIVRRPAHVQSTFGYHRAETLAALANGTLLLLVSGGILHEAWDRWQEPRDILAGPMFGIAVGGLVVNLISLKVLHAGHDENLNLRAAWLHVLGDTLGSVGVIAAAALVWACGWLWADPLASVIVCGLITISASRLVVEASRVLLEQAPDAVDVSKVRNSLLAHPAVVNVHCLHVWSIASGLRALAAHVVLREGPAPAGILGELTASVRSLFPIEHITLQIETDAFPDCLQESGCLNSAPQGNQDAHRHSANRPTT